MGRRLTAVALLFLEGAMRVRSAVSVASFVFVLAGAAYAQAPSVPPSAHLPRGTATDVPNTEIMAMVAKTAAAAVSDQAIRVVSVNNEYNVSIGVVHRAKKGPEIGGSIEHSQITEVYH